MLIKIIYNIIIALKIYNIKLPKREIFSKSIIKKLLQTIFSWTLNITIKSQVYKSSDFFLYTEIFYYIDQFHNWCYLNMIMDNEVLRGINHIKHVNNKKPSILKIFNYLQNNAASNYNYESFKNEIAELRNHGIIDETFKITIRIEEVLNFPEDDIDMTSQNSEISCLNTIIVGWWRKWSKPFFKQHNPDF